MKISKMLGLLLALMLLFSLTGCSNLDYARIDNFVEEPLLDWRGQSSLRPGFEDLASGYHFAPGEGLSMHNYKIIAPVAFTSDFTFTMDFQLDCKPTDAIDGHWNGFFVFLIEILRVPCIGADYTVPVACPPPTALATLFIRNNPVEKPLEPHLAVLMNGTSTVERTQDTGVVMDGYNQLKIVRVGDVMTLSINDKIFQEFTLLVTLWG
jgi:hypothetical protein